MLLKIGAAVYLTESNVRTRAANLTPSQLSEARASLSKTASRHRTVFLSHSHDDRAIVEPVRILLAAQGVDLYVDWKDPAMPAITSPETARLIKSRIRSADKFVMLASNTSLRSRWVPWELGLGDITKGLPNVVIFPVTPDYGQWEGSEYIGIYSRIEQANQGELAVFEPGKTTGVTLDVWLER
ncbi:MAG: toll/interleukin-1 receptor domain-containing protein [Novipirellula sp. JB048]